MSNYREARASFLFPLVASVFTTAVVTALVLTNVASAEWFFGAPAIGVASTSVVVFAERRSFLPVKRQEEESAIERFERLQRRLRVEAEIERSLEFEIERTLDLLEGKTRREGAVEYLGHGTLVPHLRETEKRRVRAGVLRAQLLRDHADAHARLVTVAHEQGIKDPGSLEPEELISRIGKATKNGI